MEHHGFHLGPGEVRFGHSRGLTLEEQVRAIFVGGRQGAIYDPSRLDSMAISTVSPQLGVGIVNGASIGLLLDGRYNYQPESPIAMNETFANSGQNWSILNQNPTTAITFLNPGVQVVVQDTSPPITLLRATNVALVTGQWYEFTVNISAVSGVGQLRIGSNFGTAIASVVGTQKLLWKAQSPYLELVRNSANVNLTISSISCRPLPGAHLEQSDNTKRPTLSLVNGLRGLSFASIGSQHLVTTGSFNLQAPFDRVAGINAGAATSNQHIFGSTLNNQVLRQASELSRYMQGNGNPAATIPNIVRGVPTIVCDRVNSSRAYISQTGRTPVVNTNVSTNPINAMSVGGNMSGSAPWDGVWYGSVFVSNGAELTATEMDLCIRWISKRTGVGP